MKGSFFRRHPWGILTALIIIGLAGWGWLWIDEQGHRKPVVWIKPRPILPELKLPAFAPPANTPGDITRYTSILDRPLFAPDRRPPPPPAPPAPPPPPDPLANLQIQGIFSGESTGILAKLDGKIRRIKIDSAIGQWTLKGIDNREVTFVSGSENRKFRLNYARLNTPAAAAPTPPAAAGNPHAGLPGLPPPGAVSNLPQNAQDEAREILRRRNELRAANGLPPITQ